MNIDAVDPEFRIDREKASILLGYAAGRDGRLYATDEAVDDWLLALGGGRFGTAVEIIRRHYASYDPQSTTPLAAITPGYIRHIAKDQAARQKRLRDHQLPPAKIDGRLMPRRILLKFQAAGKLLDRNPDEYPDR